MMSSTTVLTVLFKTTLTLGQVTTIDRLTIIGFHNKKLHYKLDIVTIYPAGLRLTLMTNCTLHNGPVFVIALINLLLIHSAPQHLGLSHKLEPENKGETTGVPVLLRQAQHCATHQHSRSSVAAAVR